MIPQNATEADLEVAYDLRGVAIVECDGRRQLANETLTREHEMEDAWLKAREKRNRPWWRIW